jgi:hypothetical protein
MHDNITVENSDMVRLLLLQLPEKLRNEAIARATKKTNEILASMLRTIAPQRTGALKKSIDMKVKKYQNGKIVVGIVGANSDYTAILTKLGTAKRLTKKNMNTAQKRIIPAKYFHLVEYGTKTRQTKNGQNRGQVTGKLFLKQTRDNAMQNIASIFDSEIMNAVR